MLPVGVRVRFDEGSLRQDVQQNRQDAEAGLLPLDIVEPDKLRELTGVESLDFDNPKDEADWISRNINAQIDSWLPRSVWEDQNTFLVVAVEKMDLVQLFAPVCEQYRVPIYPVRVAGGRRQTASGNRRHSRSRVAARRAVALRPSQAARCLTTESAEEKRDSKNPIF